MEKFAMIIVVGAAMLFTLPLLGVAIGAFSGWIVGMFFGTTILDVLRRAGFDTAGIEVWQIGAALGFVGGFFRGTGAASKA